MTIDRKELARRLRSARETAGTTQDVAASTIGVSRPAIAQIEAGRRSVSGIELDRLASLYGRDVRELLDGAPTETAEVVAHFRIDGLAEIPDVSAALDECLRIGRELAELERLVGLDRAATGAIRYDVGPPSSVRSAVAQGAQTAEAERRRMGLGDGAVEDVIDLLEAKGVRTALIDMPDNVSGLMLADPEAGPLVVVNRSHHVHRRTFSFAHEYAHVLLDTASRGHMSEVGAATKNLHEIRANAFAAALLMPEAGVRRHLLDLGKGEIGGVAREGFEGEDAETTGGRPQAAQLRIHDVALLAHAFGVNRIAMLNRLRSLRLLNQRQFERLREADAVSGRAVAGVLGLREPAHTWERDRFHRRLTRLVLEAYGTGAIDRAKAEQHLLRDVGLDGTQVSEVIGSI